MIRVAICICTRRRQEGISKLLSSLEEIIIPPDTFVKIIIVENDIHKFTEKLIKESGLHQKYEIAYYLENQQGISNARNRSVKEATGMDFCCFVDDDQVVDPDWLLELLKCQREFDADGACGPNPPVFNHKVPGYIKKFHLPETFGYGTIVKKAATNCLLLKKEWLDRIEGPFDGRLNYTGGEDTLLTRKIIEMGAIIRFTPYARAFEIIPKSRTTIKYAMTRTYRGANTRTYVQSLMYENMSFTPELFRGFLRLGYGILILIPYYIFSRDHKLTGLIKILDALGVIFLIFGRKNKFYTRKKDNNSFEKQ